VKIVLISHPSLSLATNLALHTLLPSLRHQLLTLRHILRKILSDEATLSQGDRLSVFTGTSRSDLNHRRLAQWVHLLQLRGSHHGLLVAVEDLKLIGQIELLEQPEDALGARLLEPELVSIESSAL
jgi:hypothetical protein